eukprot:3097806-Pyramimonas_sp.AAC.1
MVRSLHHEYWWDCACEKRRGGAVIILYIVAMVRSLGPARAPRAPKGPALAAGRRASVLFWRHCEHRGAAKRLSLRRQRSKEREPISR